jgi:predicted RNA-binding Zn ribbon-like protein
MVSSSAAVAGKASRYDFEGGALCLDFVNTVDDRLGRAKDLWSSFDDLVSWAEQAAITTSVEGDHLRRLGRKNPGVARKALDRARSLREALFEGFSAVVARRVFPRRALARLNAVLPGAFSRLQIRETSQGFRWDWRDPKTSPDRILWAVARSAIELLAAPTPLQLRECSDPACGWLFLDATKNHSRRWCDMKTCGNRDKARRHRLRQRTEPK